MLKSFYRLTFYLDAKSNKKVKTYFILAQFYYDYYTEN